MPTNPIDPTRVMAEALDGLALRQRVTANNVANADTPNFKASQVSFEETLQRALDDQPAGKLALVRSDSQHLPAAGTEIDTAPQVTRLAETTLRNDGNNVDIEQQMSMLAETTLRFNAVSEAMARRFAMLRMISSGGQG